MAVQVRRAAWLDSEWWRRHPTGAVAIVICGVVAAFSSLWTKGSLLLDGRGIALYARLSSTHLSTLDRVPYWLPEMWGGSPVWALGPSLPLFLLVPFTQVVGAATAVKAAVLIFQVIGGLGAYVLARSLWGRGPAAVVAGVVYSLHPMIISHGALAGIEALVGVTAATPWLAWAFRKALLGHGTRYVVASGLLSAFSVLHVAEHALALPLMCATMLVVELARPHDHGGDRQPPREVLARAGGVIAIGLAGIAYWLLPVIALGEAFVLSPPELVAAELNSGAAAQISNEIGVFFDRPTPLTGAVGYFRTGLFPQFFYVGLVCAALTLVSLVLLCRRRPHDGVSGGQSGDRHLVAILLASGLAMWFSTGSVPLIGSGPALREQIVPLALTGLGAGLLLGIFLRHIHLGRFKALGLVAAAALLLAMPFMTPYLTLQKVVPLFAVIRFPRFYTLAALGFSLGAAYPLVRFGQWIRRRGDVRPLLPLAAAVSVMALFLIDVLPMRSLYEVGPPPSADAYRRASQALPASSRLSRVATGLLEPGAAAALIDNGWQLSTGWPHPVAGRQMWRLTGQTYSGPPGFREAALGLSATAYVAVEKWSGLGTADEKVTEVEFVRNPRALPLLRTYEQVVVVDDADLAPLLATGLAYRNVAVVSRRQPLGDMFAGMPSVEAPSADLCAQESFGDLKALAGEVATACAVDPWLGALLRGTELIPLDRRPGAAFTAQADGLRGISAWLDRSETETEVALYEVGPDGSTLGTEVARAQAVGTDEYGLTAFTFDPITNSAGRRFAFVLSCDGCPVQARMIVGTAEDDDEGNVIDGGRLRTQRVAVQTPIYDRVPPASTPSTRVAATGRGPGTWTIEVDAPNPALLVVAETWFPGWKATIDGKSVPVVQADGAFLGVATGTGRHVVQLTYQRPLAADLGRFITFGTLAGLVGVAWWRRRTGGGGGSGDGDDENEGGGPGRAGGGNECGGSEPDSGDPDSGDPDSGPPADPAPTDPAGIRAAARRAAAQRAAGRAAGGRGPAPSGRVTGSAGPRPPGPDPRDRGAPGPGRAGGGPYSEPGERPRPGRPGRPRPPQDPPTVAPD